MNPAGIRPALGPLKWSEIFPKRTVFAYLSRLIPPLMDGLRRSWRLESFEIHPETQGLIENQTPVIYALWHGRMFLTLRAFDPKQLSLIISQSADGELIANALRQLGFCHIVRGSNRKGAVTSSRQMAKVLTEQKRSVYITPDGPKGPRFTAKMGVIKLASLTGAPIIPVSASAQNILRFLYQSTWDQYQFPFFFSPIRMAMGKPLSVPPNLHDEELQHYRETLEGELRTMTQSLDMAMGY